MRVERGEYALLPLPPMSRVSLCRSGRVGIFGLYVNGAVTVEDLAADIDLFWGMM